MITEGKLFKFVKCMEEYIYDSCEIKYINGDYLYVQCIGLSPKGEDVLFKAHFHTEGYEDWIENYKIKGIYLKNEHTNHEYFDIIEKHLNFIGVGTDDCDQNNF